MPRTRLGNALVCPMCAANHGKAARPHPATAARVTHLLALHEAGLSPDQIVEREMSRVGTYLPDGREIVVVRPGNGRIYRVAHDSGDGETIFHCPFCGSGQVIARSDGTTECEFCTTAFTVQVQPEMPAFPQTIDGVPVDVPGMPNGGANANVPPGSAPPGGPPGADPNDPDASGDPDAAGGNPFASASDDDSSDGDDGSDSSGGGQPPWMKKSVLLRTAAGKALNPEQYMRHLALHHTGNKRSVLEQIRRENGAVR